MASVNNLCHLCEEEDVLNVAVVWCADCATFLCKDCERHHGRSKASKDHQTISQDEYNKLPSFIVDIKNRCEKHDQKYDFYCKFHGDPCCVKCITDNHKDCRDLDPLVEVLRGIKTSAKISNLDKELSNLLENFELIVKYLNSRITTLQEHKTESLKEIRDLRASINNHLDIIEKKIIDDLSLEFNKMKLKSENLAIEIENKKRIVRNLQEDLSKITMHATNLQTFVGLQYMEESTSEDFEFLNNLQKSDKLDEFCLESKLSSDLKSFTNNVMTFGTVVTKSSPCKMQLAISGEYQVYLSVPPKSNIEDIKPKLKATLKIPNKLNDLKIYGCQVLPDGRIIILEQSSKTLLLFSKDWKYSKNLISFDDVPSDVCFIKGNLIAVTNYQRDNISLIDIVNKNISKTINVPQTCFGIDSNGELLVIAQGSQLLILDLDGNVVSKITVQGHFTVRLALYKNKIFCTDWSASHISCYTYNGDLLWTQKHKDISEPHGITIDRHGFIFVASRKNDKIEVLSEDGKSCRTIMSKINGLVYPHAINIDKQSSILLVTNFSNGNAFVFEI